MLLVVPHHATALTGRRFFILLYLSRMSEKEHRGRLISMYQLMINFGIVIAFISDTLLAPTESWRLMLGIISIPAFLLIIAVAKLPDSPRWLASKGFTTEAQKVLNVLRGNKEKAHEELQDITDSLKVKQAGFSLFRANKNVRRVVFLGMFLYFIQQFTGHNIHYVLCSKKSSVLLVLKAIQTKCLLLS